MDNSEVLENQDPDVNTPRQDTNEVQDDSVLQSIYVQANRPVVTGQDSNSRAPVVGENDHAESIANNTLSREDADKTLNYTSQQEKEYDQSVTTTNVQSGNGNISATWEPSMELSNEYFVNDEEKSTWNKMAEDMANIKFQEQVAQNRYESMASMREINQAARKAWNEYFGAEYAAAQTQEKMGWTGGQQQASDLQVKFLQAETASDMYTQREAQRYGVETKLGIARLYADANQNELALKYYQDARDTAIKEGELIGWYIPVEAKEMMIQTELADKILANPASTEEEKARAQRVKNSAQEYYDAKGFQHGYAYDDNGNVVTHYYGIKLLETMQYEETVRANKEAERLQADSNDIARKQLAVSQNQYRLAQSQLQLTYALQNAIEEQNIRDGVTSGATRTGTANGGKYYTDVVNDDGTTSRKTVDIPKGAKVYQKDGKTYVDIVVNGETRMFPTQDNVTASWDAVTKNSTTKTNDDGSTTITTHAKEYNGGGRYMTEEEYNEYKKKNGG